MLAIVGHGLTLVEKAHEIRLESCFRNFFGHFEILSLALLLGDSPVLIPVIPRGAE